MRSLTIGALAMVLAASVAVSAQTQGNGKKKGQGSPVPYGIAYEVAVDAGGDGGPNWNDSVRITVPPSETDVFVSLVCFQDATMVYALGGYPPSFAFQLASRAWTGGAAECTAYAKTTDGSKQITLGTLTFPVGA